MSVSLLRGNALTLPLADESVDLIVTSPPYFGLRSYTDGGAHYAGQIGSEPTPGEFLDALVAATREMVRVLKPTGSIFLNLGDKYATSDHPNNSGGQSALKAGGDDPRGRREAGNRRIARRDYGGIPHKSLMLIPERYRIRCVDELGLICRAVVIWSKCLSGGTNVYARVNGREKVMTVKDLARCRPGTAELWTGSAWSALVRCDQTPPTAGRGASSAAARSARYRGKPVPALAADLEIEFRNGERVGCTPNHKWPTARGIARADELRIGDVVPTVRLAAGTATPAGLDDARTGWLVGLYIAEGSRSEDMVQIASDVKEAERFGRLREIAAAFDGTFAVHHTKGNTATANLAGKVIRAILDTYVGGRTSADKRLAPSCWRRSDVFLRAVLDGYLSGDGHHDTKNDRWVLGFTANDGLATDLRALAARLGYSLRLRRVVHKFDGRDFPGWSGSLLLDPTRRRRPDSEIVAIRQSRARQFWNIEIADEPHEFALASGLLTENSNGLPESVTDRARRSHEDWVHFTKAPRYYAAVDEIREGYSPATSWKPAGRYDASFGDGTAGRHGTNGSGLRSAANPLGKLPGSVWTIPTQPLTVPPELGVDHFAAFPMEWPRRLVLGWSPPGICTECGEGRRPVSTSTPEQVRAPYNGRTARADGSEPEGNARGFNDKSRGIFANRVTITGYACACTPHTDHPGTGESYFRGTPSGGNRGSNAAGKPVIPHVARGDEGVVERTGPWREYHFDRWTPAPTRPAVVLDVFGGTGTTALVADALGRHGISVDMSHDYCRLARWRTTDPGQRASAMQVEKPPPVPAGHDDGHDLLSLLDGEATA